MSLELLNAAKKSIGTKQTSKAIEKGNAVCVFLALDADERVIMPIKTLCSQTGIPVETVETMAELGKACGIEVGAAAAAILKS